MKRLNRKRHMYGSLCCEKFTHKLLRTLQNCSRNVMDERFQTFLGQLSEMNPWTWRQHLVHFNHFSLFYLGSNIGVSDSQLISAMYVLVIKSSLEMVSSTIVYFLIRITITRFVWWASYHTGRLLTVKIRLHGWWPAKPKPVTEFQGREEALSDWRGNFFV